MNEPSRLLAALVGVAALTQCSVFDPALYRVDLASRCESAPLVAPRAQPFVVDTTGLGNSFDFARCTGTSTPGNEGVFAVEGREGQVMHFHLRAPADGANPAVVLTGACDDRSCLPMGALDECSGRNEHFSFRFTASQRYFAFVDSRTPGGSRYELTVIQTTCGNGGTLEHGESCDDGNRAAGDGCDATCHRELPAAPVASAPAEAEPNDDFANANMVRLGDARDLAVRGTLDPVCDFDMFAFEAAARFTLRATVEADGACPALTAGGLRLGFLRDTGNTIEPINQADSSPMASAFPRIDPTTDATQTWARGRDPGLYYVRLSNLVDGSAAQACRYRLRVELLDATTP